MTRLWLAVLVLLLAGCAARPVPASTLTPLPPTATATIRARAGDFARATATPDTLRYCAGGGVLRVYNHPVRDSQLVGWLQPGQRAAVIYTTGNWRMVKAGTLTGFVSASYCRIQ